MAKLTTLRKQHNLTQEELSEKTKLSVRTIQRIESGQQPKGHTLKTLTQFFEVNEHYFEAQQTTTKPQVNFTVVKLINLSTLLFTFFPPCNIIVPLLIAYFKKEMNTLTKQLISLQIVYSLFAFALFMGCAFVKNGFQLSNKFIPFCMLALVLGNVYIILKNAVSLDKHQRLSISLRFSLF